MTKAEITYAKHAPQGYMGDWTRGAPLGRPNIITLTEADCAGPVEITIREIFIDTQGYDPEGAYWGIGDPLFWYHDDADAIDATVRATTIDEAEKEIRAQFPACVITRTDDTPDDFARAYIVAALWSSIDSWTDEEGDRHEDENLDGHFTPQDIEPQSLAWMLADCRAFQTANATQLAKAYETQGYDVARAGHDFWLTRNGHGVGFWDRDLGEAGDALSEAARALGERDLFVGDDLKIHL